MRIFLTGATGVIGARALPLLVSSGHSVTAVGRSPEKRKSLERAGARVVEADMFHLASMRRALSGHDAVINLATHMPSSAMKMMLPWAWRENDRVRRVGSAVVADAARAEGVTRMIQESFAPIYGDRGDEWIDETWTVAPASYNRTILDAERSAQRFTDAGGAGVVLRFAALYGPDHMLREMLDVMRKGWSPIPGNPRAYFTSVSQEDAASAVVAALDVPAGIYNVAEVEPMRRSEWVGTLADAAKIATPRFMPSWLSQFGGSAMRLLSRSQRISSTKLRTGSKWTPRYRNAADAWPHVLAALPRS